MSVGGLKTTGARVAWSAAGVLAVLLVLTIALRLPCPRHGSIPGDQASRTASRTADARVAVTGPDAAVTRQAIDRVVAWLADTRVRPGVEGLGHLRGYVMEVHCWFLLYAFADDSAQQARYRSEVVERVRLMGDGRELVAFLQTARMPSLIADLIMFALMTRAVGAPVPALEAALPQLYQLGLVEPRRTIGVKIALAWLARSVGLTGGPTLEELCPQGMLQTRPPEASLKMRDIYDLTHEIFGVSEYGLRAVAFSPEEHAYLERSLPFWSLFHVILNLPDPGAEISICHQVAGTTGTYGYGEGMRNLLEIQSEEGTFGESRADSQDPLEIRLSHLHTSMVALHALLGHEALLRKGSLPGWPRPAAASGAGR